MSTIKGLSKHFNMQWSDHESPPDTSEPVAAIHCIFLIEAKMSLMID